MAKNSFVVEVTFKYTVPGMQPEFGHLDKHFVKNTRKEGQAGKNFEFFFPRYS